MKNEEKDIDNDLLDSILDEKDLVDDFSDDNPEELEDEKEEVINIDLLLAENKKLKEDFLRAYADAENTKRRCLQEIEKNQRYAIADFAKNLLAVADNLQRAIDSSKGAPESENIIKGIELTQEELTKVFAKFGVIKMDIMGKRFDPNFHQVIQQVEDKAKEEGTVIAELQTGYMINDRILREAMVVVSKK